MKKSMIFAAFALSACLWAGAQSSTPAAPGAMPQNPNAPQATVPADPGAASATPQAGATSQGAETQGNITQGCLGGSNPNYTLTDGQGKTYKLVLPPNANGASLTSHVGESVAVMGDKSADSINVTKMGRGNTTCTK